MSTLSRAQEYIIQVGHYGMEEGLLHTDVQSIHQDREGFMWIGTNYGLNRFDGYRFKWFTQEKHGLQTNAIDHILEDDQGWLWLINTGFWSSREVRTIDIFNPVTEQVVSFEEKFGTDLPFDPSDIISFCASDEGRLVFVTKQKKLLVYSSVDGFEVHDPGIYPLSVECFSRHNTIWCHASKTDDNLRDVIVEIDLKGMIVHRYEHDFPFQHNFIAGVDKNDNLWYLSRNWKDKRFEKNQKGRIFKIDPSGVEHVFLLEDSALPEGAVNLDLPLIGYQYGFWLNPEKDNFWLFNKGSFLGFHPAAGWSQELVENYKELAHPNVVFFDKAGKAWVGTVFGLHVIDLNPNPFQSLAYDPEKKSVLAFRGITQDKQNTLWACIDRGGGWLGRFKATGVAYETEIIGPEKAALGRGYKYGIFSDEMGNLWFGSGQENIITRYNPENNSLQYFPYQISNEGQVNIWSFYKDKNGMIWFGTDNGVIGYIGANNSVSLLPKMENISAKGGCIYQFLEDATGQVWLCTDDGLYQLNVERKSAMPYHPKGFDFLQKGIYHAHIDADGSFWLGSNGLGLFKWKPESEAYLRFTRADGLSDNTIYAVYEDDSDNLWLPTNNGINRFNKKTFRSKAFLEKDGVSGHEFNRISHYQGKDGTLFLGGINGLTSFHPKDIAKEYSTGSLPLVITEFQQFDGEQNKLVERTAGLRNNRKITMFPSDRYFRIAFALLEYINLESVQYGYRIEDIDKEWTFQKENSIQLGRLPYGKHTLKIKAQAANGQWSDYELAIEIEVLKPFYLQTWFVLCLIFLTIAAIVSYVKYNTYTLKARNRLLEESVKARTVTIAEQAGELRKLDQLKSRFFANVSHELRTPLTLIVAPLTSMLKREYWKEKDLILLQMMQRNGNLLLKLVNEILDLSKLETGRIEVYETPVRLFEYMRPFVAQFSSFGDSVRVKFHYDYRADRELVVLLDKDKVEKIINNFLSNALKFSPLGSTVDLMVEEQDQSLLVKVKDSGPGIHPNDLPHIFDRFFQSKQPDAMIQGGTGIGLALCKELADLLHGKVWVESEYGVGSTFFFQFPMIKADRASLSRQDNSDDVEQANIPVAVSAPVKPSLASAHPKILIVEDNADLRLFMRSFLGDQYQIHEAVNGKEGLDLLQSGLNPDLIVSDVMMPVMDGIRMLELVKAKDHLRHIPFIILTARSDVKVKLRTLKLGVDDYLVKPFDEEELLARIENLLRFADGRPRQKTSALAIDANQTGGQTPSDLPEDSQVVITAEDAKWLSQLEIVTNKHLRNFNFNADFLAAQLNMSARQLQRQIKSSTGLTTNQYVQEARLQQARELLESGKVLVKQAAAQVGFKDVKHFTGLYKSRFGKLPSED